VLCHCSVRGFDVGLFDVQLEFHASEFRLFVDVTTWRSLATPRCGCHGDRSPVTSQMTSVFAKFKPNVGFSYAKATTTELSTCINIVLCNSQQAAISTSPCTARINVHTGRFSPDECALYLRT